MVDLQPKGRCVKCSYDLRGIKSKVCPECGTSTNPASVRISDPQQFHFARAALEHAGLLIHAVEPGGSFGTPGILEGMPPIGGWLYVDPDRLEKVEACLDSAGVFWQVRPVPIVDRSDPMCPSCHVKLSIDGPEECSNCGDAFQWVDIEEPPVDPTAMLCRQCGYDLTGNTSGRCPECDWQIGVVVDQLVAAATDASREERASEATILAARKWFMRAFWSTIAVTLIVLSIIGGSVLGAPTGVGLLVGTAVAFMGLIGLAVGLAILARLMTSK